MALTGLVDAQTTKKLTGKAIFSYIQSLGYAEEQYRDGHWVKVVSEDGLKHGLEMGDRVSRTGTIYEDLYYTQDAQRIIVESFVTT